MKALPDPTTSVPRECSNQETLHHYSLKSSGWLAQVCKTKMLNSKSPFTVDVKMQVCVGAVMVRRRQEVAF